MSQDVSNRWTGKWTGRVEWTMEWNMEYSRGFTLCSSFFIPSNSVGPQKSLPYCSKGY